MKKRRITEKDYIKAIRRASRQAEIELHGKPVGGQRVHRSKKLYSRKKSKADLSKDLP
jgi:hypothetical protein